MLKKLLCVSVIVLLCFSCLPVFSSAEVIYTSLPEPVPTDLIQYFVLATDGYNPVLISFNRTYTDTSDPLTWEAYIDHTGRWNFKLGPLSSATIFPALDVLVFDIVTGRCIAEHELSYNSELYGYLFSPGYMDTHFLSYGVAIDDSVGSSGKMPAEIAWNDSTDPETYENWLNSIYLQLYDIDLNTDNIENQLSSINSQLSLFYNLFNSYQMQQHSDLINIYNKIIDIYNLLSEEQETYAPVEQGSQIDQFIQAESALNKDFSGDLQNQFNTAGNIFTGNSAFAFISNTFQDLILSNMSLNSLIIFSLAIGLCVLVLGRRLNA